jgi:hypothetical protein
MNVAGKSENLNETLNVLPLFANVEIVADPLETLIAEGEMEWSFEELNQYSPKKRHLVQASQFPDQSIYVLEQQISSLKDSLERLKFYLSDLDDLLPSSQN